MSFEGFLIAGVLLILASMTLAWFLGDRMNDRAETLRHAEGAMREGRTKALRALLAMRGHHLTRSQRAECYAWLHTEDEKNLEGP